MVVMVVVFVRMCVFLLKLMGGAGGILLFHPFSLCCLYLFGLDLCCQFAGYICIFSV
jgi:hypothetical protein